MRVKYHIQSTFIVIGPRQTVCSKFYLCLTRSEDSLSKYASRIFLFDILRTFASFLIWCLFIKWLYHLNWMLENIYCKTLFYSIFLRTLFALPRECIFVLCIVYKYISIQYVWFFKKLTEEKQVSAKINGQYHNLVRMDWHSQLKWFFM